MNLSEADGPVLSAPPPTSSSSINLGWKDNTLAWLEVEQSVLAWGEVLQGSLVLQGGGRQYRITHSVQATLSYSAGEAKCSLASAIVLPAPHVIEPGTIRRFPLQLPIPSTTPFAYVDLDVVIHGALWCDGPRLCIQVVPPVACMVIGAQFRALARMRHHRWERTAEGDIVGWFRPLDRQSLFTEAAIKLFGPIPPWQGRLLVTQHPRWRWDLDRVCLDLPLLANDPNTIQEQLLRVLRKAGFRPGDARDLPLVVDCLEGHVRDLPVAAGGPDETWADFPEGERTRSGDMKAASVLLPLGGSDESER